MTLFSSCSVAIEHSPGSWTDYTSRLRMPVTIRRGRPTKYADIGAAVFKATFDNHDGDLMPDLIGTSGYPNLVEGKRIRFQITKSGTTYTRFLGPISQIEPEFPDRSLAKAKCTITAVDSLAVLAQKELHSNWTEQHLYVARSASVEADAWEPTDQVNGFYATLTNFTENDGHPGPLGIYLVGSPALSFGTDPLSSFGEVINVTPDSSDHSSLTRVGIVGGTLAIQFMFKSPRDHTPSTSTVYTFATLVDSSANNICNLIVKDYSGSNAYFVYSADLSTSLGVVSLNLGNDQWHVMNISQNATNANHTDFGIVRCIDGSALATNDIAVDIRNVEGIGLPGFQGNVLPHSSGGVLGIKQRSLHGYQHAIRTGNQTVSERITSLAGACSRLPVSFTQVGTWTALACTGDWSGRNALDVAREIARSVRRSPDGSNGIIFARPRDSEILAISGSETHPATPLLEVDWEDDLLIGTKTSTGVDNRPTRVTVTSPQTTAVAVDSAAESAGEDRPITITTVNRDGYSDAADIAAFLLARNKGLNFEKIRIDLDGAVNDPVATLFDESGTNSGLFPTGKVRIVGLPESHFTYPSRDIWIEGWTEHFDEGEAWLEGDCISSQVVTRASDYFSGTDGSSWDSQWIAGQTGTGGSCTLQGNRGRISPGTTSSAYTTRRLDLPTRKDGELSGSFILGHTNSQLYIWCCANSALSTDGYVLHITAHGTLYLERRVSSSITTVATESRTLTPSTVQYGFRIWRVDGLINARVWTWGYSEQKEWVMKYVDPSPISGAGHWGVGAINDGSSATSRTVDIDDIVLTDAGSGA